MSPGGRAGGKHWTNAEVESRQEAASETKRERRVTLKPPAWLSEDALKVWKDIRNKLQGIDLLDNLDTELLAIYCDAIIHYRELDRAIAVGRGRPERQAGISRGPGQSDASLGANRDGVCRQAGANPRRPGQVGQEESREEGR